MPRNSYHNGAIAYINSGCRAEMYAKGRITAGPNALVQRGVKAILGAAARRRTGKTFLAVDFVDGKLGAVCLLPVCLLFDCCLLAVCLLLLALGVVGWQPLAQFIDAGGLLRGQGGNHLPQFQTWLKQEHGKELPLPRVGAKMEIDKKVYSKGVRILDRDDIA